MNTTVLNLNEKASEVVNHLMDPGVLANRTDTLEELLDLLFDECNAPDIDDSETLRREARCPFPLIRIVLNLHRMKFLLILS